MKTEPCTAFILHRRNYRETSLLLDIFSREHGRVSLIAKGAKRKKSDQAELLQPYHRLRISWSGQGELMTLNSVEADRPPYRLLQDCLIAGFYLNELIVRLLHPHEAHMDLFDHYDAALNALSGSKPPMEAVIRIFEKNLLESLGYGLVLDHDVDTRERIEPGLFYDYQPDRGPSRITAETAIPIRVSGQTLLALDKEVFHSDEILRDAKKFMRSIIRSHLGNKRLLSRELYQSYINNSKPGNN